MKKIANNQTDFLLAIILLSIILLGVFGNILNLIVFSHKTMLKMSTFRLLFYLSIIDLLVLLVCTTDALFTFGFLVEIRLFSTLMCRLHTFLTYFLTHMSSVVLMIVSIDRALVVCNKSVVGLLSNKRAKKRKTKNEQNSSSNPLRITSFKFKFNLITLNRVEKLLLLVVLFLILINGHYLLFLEINSIDLVVIKDSLNNLQEFKLLKELVNKTKLITDSSGVNDFKICFPMNETLYNYFLNYIWIWIDTFIYSIIPFIVMVVCSVIILTEISKSKSKLFLNNQRNKNICRKRSKRNKQLFVMLLVTNLYFVLCSLPLCVTMTYNKLKYDQNETSFLQTFLHIMAYSNNSVNFLFYLMFSQKYRLVIGNLLSLKSENDRRSLKRSNRTITNGHCTSNHSYFYTSTMRRIKTTIDEPEE
jgi:hypothetical protein